MKINEDDAMMLSSLICKSSLEIADLSLKQIVFFAARKLIDQQTLERKLQNHNNNSELTVFYYLGYVHRVLMDFIRLFYYQIF